MKKINKISLLSTLLISNNALSIELSKHLSTSTEPTPKIRIEPKYPVSAARQRREGWANFSFIIEKDGSVSNVITQENSGSKDITLAAKKAVMKWQYEPAMENGEPVQQCVNSVQLNFRMNKDGAQGVTRRFKSLYNKTKEALDARDYTKVKELLRKFETLTNMHLSEYNFLQLLSARYAREIGDDAIQLSHLKKVKFSSDNKDAEQALAILDQRFVLEVQLNQLQSAYKTYKRIERMAVAAPDLTRYKKIIKHVDEFVNSTNELVINADILDNDYFHHALVRNKFTITNISGALTKMDIRCANKRHLYSIESNNTWAIPEAWQQCHIFIFGEKNSTFNLIEHPFEA